MIGFTQVEPMEVSASIATISEDVDLIKDNDGNAYWPIYGFNGIGGYFGQNRATNSGQTVPMISV